MVERNYYEVLDVPRNATTEQISRQYKLLAYQFHPDRSKDPRHPLKFLRVKEASETLLDPLKRLKYDLQNSLIEWTTEQIVKLNDMQRARADQAVALMHETVARNRLNEEPDGLIILKARYGILTPLSSGASSDSEDSDSDVDDERESKHHAASRSQPPAPPLPHSRPSRLTGNASRPSALHSSTNNSKLKPGGALPQLSRPTTLRRTGQDQYLERVERSREPSREFSRQMVEHIRTGSAAAAGGDKASSASRRKQHLCMDVTIPLQCMVQDSQVRIPRGVPKSTLDGFYDPVTDDSVLDDLHAAAARAAGGLRKQLDIQYKFHQKLHHVRVDDTEPLAIPLQEHCVMARASALQRATDKIRRKAQEEKQKKRTRRLIVSVILGSIAFAFGALCFSLSEDLPKFVKSAAKSAAGGGSSCSGGNGCRSGANAAGKKNGRKNAMQKYEHTKAVSMRANTAQSNGVDAPKTHAKPAYVAATPTQVAPLALVPPNPLAAHHGQHSHSRAPLSSAVVQHALPQRAAAPAYGALPRSAFPSPVGVTSSPVDVITPSWIPACSSSTAIPTANSSAISNPASAALPRSRNAHSFSFDSVADSIADTLSSLFGTSSLDSSATSQFTAALACALDTVLEQASALPNFLATQQATDSSASPAGFDNALTASLAQSFFNFSRAMRDAGSSLQVANLSSAFAAFQPVAAVSSFLPHHVLPRRSLSAPTVSFPLFSLLRSTLSSMPTAKLGGGLFSSARVSPSCAQPNSAVVCRRSYVSLGVFSPQVHVDSRASVAQQSGGGPLLFPFLRVRRGGKSDRPRVDLPAPAVQLLSALNTFVSENPH